MERLKPIPLLRRFGVRVLMFNAILVLSIIVPTVVVRNQDYKYLTDRISFQSALFSYCLDSLRETDAAEWPAVTAGLPRIFYQQRICVFDVDRNLVFDSGVMVRESHFGRPRLRLLLPDPYIDWLTEDEDLQPDVYIEHLLAIDTDSLDPDTKYHSTRNVRYDAGLDRVVLMGRMIRSADDVPLIFTLSQSVVDILIQWRALKERFLFLYSAVALLAILLTFALSRSVTRPLNILYDRSREILEGRRPAADFPPVMAGGEVGDACRALQRLVAEQRRPAEDFMRFSSDIVHELKTPLAAIRSGLEVYAESADDDERAEVYARTNRVIANMENLMNEIQFLGGVESGTEEGECSDVMAVCADVLRELGDAGIETEYGPGVAASRLPLSCEKLYRVLSNLLGNAVSFSPERESVSLSLRVDGGCLVIAVRDRGPGIPVEIFDHILDRFFTFRPAALGDTVTADNTVPAEEALPPGSRQGTAGAGGRQGADRAGARHSGLGLSIVNAILRECGGSLEYRNREGGEGAGEPPCGAEFVCRIPVKG